MQPEKKPRPKKGKRSTQAQSLKLKKQKRVTAVQITEALQEAGKALDQLGSENAALRRIIVSERAQLIYYMEMAEGFSKGEKILGTLQNFMELPEPSKQAYVKKAIEELGKGPIEPPKLADAQGREITPGVKVH